MHIVGFDLRSFICGILITLAFFGLTLFMAAFRMYNDKKENKS